MTSDLRGQGHSRLPLQLLQSLEKFLLLLNNIYNIDQVKHVNFKALKESQSI